MKFKYLKYIIYAIFIITILWMWELAANLENTDGSPNLVRLFISSPSRSAEYYMANARKINIDLLVTAYEAGAGLLIATIFSFAAMIVCFHVPRLMDVILPVFVTSQVIPIVTLAPLFIVVLGMGITSKIAMAALMCFFPIFIDFGAGVKAISGNIKELLFVYDAPTSYKIYKVYFPLALPHIFSGLKVSATLAVIGAIVAEFMGAQLGLGWNLFLAGKRLDSELLICSIFSTSLLGAMLFGIVALIEKMVGGWYLHNANNNYNESK